MNKRKQARASLESATRDLKSYADGIIQTSENLNKLSTAALYGVVGGVVGMLIGGLIPNIQFLPQAGVIALMSLAGIAGGIIFHRSGSKGIQQEQRLKAHRMVRQEMLSGINDARKLNAPEAVLLKLWGQYENHNLNLQDSSQITQPRIGGVTGATIYIGSEDLHKTDAKSGEA
ncbi:hypothetical protein ACUN0G_13210 [Pseudomonas sp. 32A]|uniref:Uncharacterized protein n=1 Tax=Pseudomonas orientalis TaxID=76758 RepID=A0A4Q7D1H5_9PSED|nr:hypothetical protein [Pseudomonas orientalis]RZI32665.1 hypothetical protein EUX57_05275 [Pseudomonas orientalis]